MDLMLELVIIELGEGTGGSPLWPHGEVTHRKLKRAVEKNWLPETGKTNHIPQELPGNSLHSSRWIVLVWRQHNNSHAEDKPVNRMTLKNRWNAALCSQLCYQKKVILPRSVQKMIIKALGFKEISVLSAYKKRKKSMKWALWSLFLNSKLRSMNYSYLLLVWTLRWSSNLEKFSGDCFSVFYSCVPW